MIKKEEFERQREEQWDRIKKYLAVFGEVNDLVIQRVVAFDMFEQGYKLAIESIGNKYQSGDNLVDEEEPQEESYTHISDRCYILFDCEEEKIRERGSFKTIISSVAFQKGSVETIKELSIGQECAVNGYYSGQYKIERVY